MLDQVNEKDNKHSYLTVQFNITKFRSETKQESVRYTHNQITGTTTNDNITPQRTRADWM